MPTILPSGHGDLGRCPILAPWEAWVSRLDSQGAEGARDYMPSKQSPLAPVRRTGPLRMGPQSPDAGGPFRSYMKPGASKDWWALRPGRASRSQQVSWTCPGGNSAPASGRHHPQQNWFCRGWDLSVGRRGKGMRHRPLGLCPGTFCSITTRNWLAFLRFWLPRWSDLGVRSPAALWLFLITINFKTKVYGLFTFNNPAGLQMTPALRNARG